MDKTKILKEVKEALKNEGMGIIEDGVDSELTRPCPPLIEQNVIRLANWQKDNPRVNFNIESESIVSKEHCKSYVHGEGCRHIERCWKE